ncbi:ABC transporter substrate-binding protein [Pseudobutyrivibrio sp.]|uniref:ABC transporter substrate-binding protein n=1 Tax=Pseudobutyrivibrio sp. TaxID=2014367 RepID=UPI001DE3F886|nr:ABC transporter substrate-binding protein [Pseudobutyrivibrio sp.]MBE5911134.1 ABC transporter substrate-binding protein [Pseudobutyrivibrio sp.]
MKLRKMVALGLTVITTFAMVACGSNSGTTDNTNTAGETGEASTAPTASNIFDANVDPDNTEKSDEQIVIQLTSEPSGLWAGGTGKQENECVIIGSALFDTLVHVDRNTGDVLPALASEWEWIDDTHCKFTLRDDVIMSDGSPLVADDVVYCVNTWMQQSPNTDTGRFLSGAVADDEHTVTIEFNTTAPDFLNLLAWGNFGIVSEDEVNALGGYEAADKNPVMGSGKYRFKEWVNGQYILLERNDDYWDDNYVGYFKEIKLVFIQDPAARAMSILSGDAQVAYNMPINTAATYAGNEEINLIVHGFGQNTRLWYNMGPNAGATSDIRVRQAIDKALNFDAIAQVGTGGFGTEVHGYFPDDSIYYNETFTAEERAVDIEGAKALLEEAGYGDGLDLTLVGMQDQEQVFTVIQDNLSQVGINVTIEILDTPAFVGAANSGDYDLIHVGDMVDARYPAICTFFRQSSIDTFCIGGAKWTTPEIEEILDKLIQEPDETKAKEYAKEFEDLVKESMPFSNTFPEMYANMTSKDIKGYKTLERGYIDITSLYK